MKLHTSRRFEVFKDYRATNFVYNVLNVEQAEINRLFENAYIPRS